MLSLFKPGQVLPGRLSTYTLVKELSNKRESWLTGDQTSVFLATYVFFPTSALEMRPSSKLHLTTRQQRAG